MTDFPENLDEAFKSDIMPFRELPLGDYKILQQTTTMTEDDRECMILKLINKNQEEFTTFAPERIKTDLTKAKQLLKTSWPKNIKIVRK